MSEHPAPTPDAGPVAAPPAAGAGRGLPGWAIALIAVGSIAVLGGFFALMLWLGAQERPAEAGREGEGSGRAEASEPHRALRLRGLRLRGLRLERLRRLPPGEPVEPRGRHGGRGVRAAAGGGTRRLSKAVGVRRVHVRRVSRPDAGRHDNRPRVPGGDSVDPDYIGAFLFILSDYKSAARSQTPSAAAPPRSCWTSGRASLRSRRDSWRARISAPPCATSAPTAASSSRTASTARSTDRPRSPEDARSAPSPPGGSEPGGGADAPHGLAALLAVETADVELAVEVVALVLQRLGEQPLPRDHDLPAVEVDAAHGRPRVAHHVEPQLGHRQAALARGQRWDEAGLAFKEIAMNHADRDVGIYAAQLYLESINVLGSNMNPPRPQCYDDMAGDVPQVHRALLPGREGDEEPRAVRHHEAHSGGHSAPSAQKLVEKADKGGASALQDYEKAGGLYLELYRNDCERRCVRASRRPPRSATSSCTTRPARSKPAASSPSHRGPHDSAEPAEQDGEERSRSQGDVRDWR